VEPPLPGYIREIDESLTSNEVIGELLTRLSRIGRIKRLLFDLSKYHR
jgi:hypothetical protein